MDATPELHVVTDVDVAAATDAVEWTGRTVPPGHVVRTGYVALHGRPEPLVAWLVPLPR